MIPCKNCITLSICKAFIAQREETFNIVVLAGTFKYIEEEYNGSTIWRLMYKCSLLHNYLPCEISLYQIRKSKDTKIDDWLWYDRVNKVFAFFGLKGPAD